MCNFQHASTPITKQKSCIFVSDSWLPLVSKSIQQIHNMPLTISTDTIFTENLILDLLSKNIKIFVLLSFQLLSEKLLPTEY